MLIALWRGILLQTLRGCMALNSWATSWKEIQPGFPYVTMLLFSSFISIKVSLHKLPVFSTGIFDTHNVSITRMSPYLSAFYSLILIFENISIFKKGHIWALIGQVRLYNPLLYSGLISFPANSRFECLRISRAEHGFSLRPLQFWAVQSQGQWHLWQNLSCDVNTSPTSSWHSVNWYINYYTLQWKCKHMKEVVLIYFFQYSNESCFNHNSSQKHSIVKWQPYQWHTMNSHYSNTRQKKSIWFPGRKWLTCTFCFKKHLPMAVFFLSHCRFTCQAKWSTGREELNYAQGLYQEEKNNNVLDYFIESKADNTENCQGPPLGLI